MGDERLTLSVAETAIALGVSVPTVRREIREGRLRVLRIGPKRIRVPVKALAEYVNGPKDAA